MGFGVPMDNVKAYMWLNLSAAPGNKDAEILRNNTAKNMTPDQIAEAQLLSKKWKPVAKTASDPHLDVGSLNTDSGPLASTP